MNSFNSLKLPPCRSPIACLWPPDASGVQNPPQKGAPSMPSWPSHSSPEHPSQPASQPASQFRRTRKAAAPTHPHAAAGERRRHTEVAVHGGDGMGLRRACARRLSLRPQPHVPQRGQRALLQQPRQRAVVLLQKNRAAQAGAGRGGAGRGGGGSMNVLSRVGRGRRCPDGASRGRSPAVGELSGWLCCR
jgi:hypothetical protein